MSDERGDVGPEFYEDQEWSEKELTHLIRREVSIYTDEKFSTMFDDVGIFRLDGALSIAENGEGEPRVQVDYFNLDQFIAKNFSDGDDVTVLVMQGDLTNRDDESKDN